MNHLTLQKANEKWEVTPRRINYYCSAGAEKMGKVWLLPKDAEKPADKRVKLEK